MPYYHIRITYETYNKRDYDYEIDLSEEETKATVERIIQHRGTGQTIFFNGKWFKAEDVREIRVKETPQKFIDNSTSGGFNLFHLPNIPDVTRKFIKSPSQTEAFKSEKGTKPLSKNVFIVHGTDYNPANELKAILEEIGLNPIILHEQPSGSRTIIEKLEEYSEDIGFAFILLTPDDALVPSVRTSIVNEKQGTVSPIFITPSLKPIFRARQNVILEFGYFIARIGRKRVCCLYKENIELPFDKPSDMQGIAYIPFKESVKEAINAIIKELKAAGYDIRV
jgi:predicted nucleotide-binding protein